MSPASVLGGDPEFQLLVALTQPRQTVHIPNGIDWTRLKALAERHRVTPIVYRSLAAAAPPELPVPVLQKLKNAYAANARRALRQATETVRITRKLWRAGIDAAPFKGSPLASQLYGNVAYRHAGDIDLLIPAQAYPQADALLTQDGFLRETPATAPAPHRLSQLQRRRKDAIYRHSQYGYTLELHWRMLAMPSFFPLPVAMSQRIELAGEALPAMPLDTLAIYLCAHGAWSGWFRLKWLVDIGVLVTDHGIDTEEVLSLARSYGLERVVLQALALCQQVLGLEVAITPEALPACLIDYPLWAMHHDDPYPRSMPSLALLRRRLMYSTRLKGDLTVKADYLRYLFGRLYERRLSRTETGRRAHA